MVDILKVWYGYDISKTRELKVISIYFFGSLFSYSHHLQKTKRVSRVTPIAIIVVVVVIVVAPT